jgi:hypothetical protein
LAVKRPNPLEAPVMTMILFMNGLLSFDELRLQPLVMGL